MVDSKPASQHDSKPAALKGWELIVYVDDYCRDSNKVLALAALARTQNGVDRVNRLATFFSAVQTVLRASRNAPLQTDTSTTGAAAPKPKRDTPASRSAFKR